MLETRQARRSIVWKQDLFASRSKAKTSDFLECPNHAPDLFKVNFGVLLGQDLDLIRLRGQNTLPSCGRRT